MIKVMSFNIRYGLADDGVNHWQKRKTLAMARIQTFGPDLLGLQECRDDDQAEYIRTNLPDHHFLGVHRGGPGETALEMAPLLVRKSAFILLDSGCFWLSETPTIPGSTSWASAFPRTVCWARLRCRFTGGELLYVNTHFDYEPTAIDGDAHCLHDWLDQFLPQTPLILTGDFNTERKSEAYRLLTASSGLIDTIRFLHPSEADAVTFHGFGNPVAGEAIDWILASSHFRIVAAAIDRMHNGLLYPSDHYPITALLDWEQ
jgi:endonuclease/exonuclease/phosphatase family metal-dependent hydrolase